MAAFSEGAAAQGRRARLPEAALCAIEGARACITQAGRRSIFPAASAAPDLTMDLDEPARTKRAVKLAQVRRIRGRNLLPRASRWHSRSDALSSAPLALRRCCKRPPRPALRPDDWPDVQERPGEYVVDILTGLPTRALRVMPLGVTLNIFGVVSRLSRFK